MIRFNCQVETLIPFTELLPFQGNLKSSTEAEIATLASSLLEDGQITPFMVWHQPCPEGQDEEAWHKEQPHYIIDGHRRLLAIQHIAIDNPAVLKQAYPVMIIEASDVETAKKQLLQICSSYGKITPKGLQVFLNDTPNIKLDKLGIKVNLPQVKLKGTKVDIDEHVVMRIKVKKEDVPQITSLLASAKIEVL